MPWRHWDTVHCPEEGQVPRPACPPPPSPPASLPSPRTTCPHPGPPATCVTKIREIGSVVRDTDPLNTPSTTLAPPSGTPTLALATQISRGGLHAILHSKHKTNAGIMLYSLWRCTNNNHALVQRLVVEPMNQWWFHPWSLQCGDRL